MQKTVWLLVGFLINASLAHAEEVPNLVLDKVSFEISAKQWVTTQTALLSISIHTALNNGDVVKARTDIMDRLSKIAKGDWQLVQFERSQDSSGLEKLMVQAQVRVAQSGLTNIYQSAKSVSKPGAHYEIESVDFKPGLEEIQQGEAQLRERLYQQVRDEIVRLDKIYPEQHYSLSSVTFTSNNDAFKPKTYQGRERVNALATASTSVPLTVSNELLLTAMVEVASNRNKG